MPQPHLELATSNSWQQFSCLDDAISGILELKASPVEDQKLQLKDKRRGKRKSERKMIKLKAKSGGALCRPKNIFNVRHLRVPQQKCYKTIKCDASGKKGMLSFSKCPFERFGAALAHVKNVQKMCFY